MSKLAVARAILAEIAGLLAPPDYGVMNASASEDLHVPAVKPSFFEALYASLNHDAIDFSPGPARQSGATTDLMIDGDGFFAIKTPQGERYTRQGAFLVNSEGYLVTTDGHRVLGRQGDGGIEVKTPRFEVKTDGTILDAEKKQIGELRLVTFAKPGLLEKEGAALLRPRGAGVQPVEIDKKDVQVRQGFLEGSNVQIIDELVSMIMTHRAYESFQKLIQTSAQMNEQCISTLA